jgi:hypothetical protein
MLRRSSRILSYRCCCRRTHCYRRKRLRRRFHFRMSRRPPIHRILRPGPTIQLLMPLQRQLRLFLLLPNPSEVSLMLSGLRGEAAVYGVCQDEYPNEWAEALADPLNEAFPSATPLVWVVWVAVVVADPGPTLISDPASPKLVTIAVPPRWLEAFVVVDALAPLLTVEPANACAERRPRQTAVNTIRRMRNSVAVDDWNRGQRCRPRAPTAQ